MARRNVITEEGFLEGWFDLDKAQGFAEETFHDGRNNISVNTRDQWSHEELYLTRKRRWIKHCWSRWPGGSG